MGRFVFYRVLFVYLSCYLNNNERRYYTFNTVTCGNKYKRCHRRKLICIGNNAITCWQIAKLFFGDLNRCRQGLCACFSPIYPYRIDTLSDINITNTKF